MRTLHSSTRAILLLFLLGSCALYKRDILFKADKETEKTLRARADSVLTPRNYRIARNDLIEFQIFTNKGEFIVDPTAELSKQASNVSSGSRIRYLVQGDGMVNLPILGKVRVDSLTLDQFDSTMSVLYGKYYQDVYVVSKVANRRIFVLSTGASNLFGATGSRALVVDLENENTTLFEVLSKVGGVGLYGMAHRIKVIRGDMRKPLIFTVDLTEVNSFTKANLIMQPNDVVYVEPLRRSAVEFIRDATQYTAILNVFLTIFLFTRF